MAVTNLTLGATVYADDGTKLGTIERFFSAAPLPAPVQSAEEVSLAQTNANSTTDDAGELFYGVDDTPRSAVTPGTGPGVSFGPSDTKYFEVHHGGHLLRHGTSLYVPFVAVTVVEDDGSIVVGYSAEKATSLFGEKPSELDS